MMRNLGLDVLRLIAIVLVLGRHLELPSEEPGFLSVWNTGGWIGVDLFFVLSGFLVSGLLFKEYIRDGKVELKRFLIRRGLKIYPPFYALILFTVLMNLAVGEPMRPIPLIGEIFFLQNYLGGLLPHTWSLAVEEHFYIAIAILCYVVLRPPSVGQGKREPFRIIPSAFLVVAVFCLLMRIGNLLFVEEYSHQWFLFATHIRIDSLMFGVLISYLWHFHGLEARIRRIPTAGFVMAGVLLLCPAFVFPVHQYRLVPAFGVILFYVGSGLLVLAALRLRSSDSRVLNLCGLLGASSYSIYLWHMTIADWGWRAVGKLTGLEGYVWYFLFYIVGALVFGLVMSRVIEWPVLKFRDRFFPSRSIRGGSPPAGRDVELSETPV